jgi:DTW domain-containing protein YfiP
MARLVMSRRGNFAVRCSGCRLHESLCACALIPRLETRTKLLLLIHHFEDRKSTNTGRLASRCLSNSEVVVRGRESEPATTFTPEAGTRPVLLFPHPGALPLSELSQSPEPLTLIVPDGTWRQASKVRNRVPGLSELPCVTLPRGEPSRYRLRLEAHETGVSTLEAIARAMGILEGEHVQRALERVMAVVVDRILWSRGTIATEDVQGGIPEGALRHDPRSGARAP